MNKVIENIELLKKLQPYLNNIDTIYYINPQNIVNRNFFNNTHLKKIKALKTLTEDEAYNLLPSSLNDKSMNITKSEKKTYIQYYEVNENGEINNEQDYLEESGKSLLEAIEKILEYLIDNNLLSNETNG